MIRRLCTVILVGMMLLAMVGCGTATVSEKSSQSAAPQETNKNDKMDLDLMIPSECMQFMENALYEIETEEKIPLGDTIKYTADYTVEYIANHTNDDTVVMTLHDLSGSELYIIADAATKEYRHFRASTEYELMTYNDVEASFICRSGQRVLEHPNFPYKDIYSFEEERWSKVHMPINNGNVYHKLGGYANSFGKLASIEVADAQAKIIFSFEELIKDPSIGGVLPILYYRYDPITGKATLSFSGIEFNDAGVVKQLEQLPGITGARMTKTAVVDMDAKQGGIASAMEITFNVAPEYDLYGEYSDTEWDPPPHIIESGGIFLRLWTKKM